ncbi:hypothetical protein [Geotalea toluenoxydans]|uniref:hypothetical protein n=1 Tax=Geotalea toluenoxydans TaxID=421624 RepID=UPI000A3E7035|nr:hypothetical protein [Geotalea toluenoxydans]
MKNGVLYFLQEVDAENNPLFSLAGATVRFRLELLNPYFMNFTNINVSPKRVLYYRNGTLPERFESASEVAVTTDLLSHTIISKVRPLSLVLRDDSGHILAEEMAANAEFREARFTLNGYSGRSFMVDEGAPDSETMTWYYRDAEMLQAGGLAIVEVAIDDSFYQSKDAPMQLNLPFERKEEFLEYFVVAKGYSEEELDQVKVEEKGQGNGNNGDSKTSFERVSPEEMPPGYKGLGGMEARVALFRSEKPVPRAEAGTRKMQLLRNDETLIKSLPLPAADKPDGRSSSTYRKDKEPIMRPLRTPDVYVEEISLFPPSVAEVETAVPAFVGYTARATKITDKDLSMVPTKIKSLPDFEMYFGGAPAVVPKEVNLDEATTLSAPTSRAETSTFTTACGFSSITGGEMLHRFRRKL